MTKFVEGRRTQRGTGRFGLFALLAMLLLAMTGLTATASAEEPQWERVAGTGDSVVYRSSDGAEAGWIPIDEYVSTRSASGCDDDVCIDVNGGGTFVSQWASQAFGNVGCTVGHFQSYASDIRTPVICSTQPGDGVYFYNNGPTGYFMDQEWLCNTWDRISGRPCIQIEA